MAESGVIRASASLATSMRRGRVTWMESLIFRVKDLIRPWSGEREKASSIASLSR